MPCRAKTRPKTLPRAELGVASIYLCLCACTDVPASTCERITLVPIATNDLDAFSLVLPRRRAGSGTPIVDINGRALLLELRYASTRETSGGIAESGEDPRTPCTREIRNELGLDVRSGRLLMLEHETNPPQRGVSDHVRLRWRHAHGRDEHQSPHVELRSLPLGGR